MNTLLEAFKGLKESKLTDDIKVDTGLTGKINYDILQGVLGQLSDGHWENSKAAEKYWKHLDVEHDGDKVFITAPSDYKYMYNWNNEKDIKEYFANKIKQIVKIEGLNWKRDNQDSVTYLHGDPTVADAYKAYDILKGRDTSNKKYEDLESGKLNEGGIEVSNIFNIQPSFNSNTGGDGGDSGYDLEITSTVSGEVLYSDKGTKTKPCNCIFVSKDQGYKDTPVVADNELTIEILENDFDVDDEEDIKLILNYIKEGKFKEACDILSKYSVVDMTQDYSIFEDEIWGDYSDGEFDYEPDYEED